MFFQIIFIRSIIRKLYCQIQINEIQIKKICSFWAYFFFDKICEVVKNLETITDTFGIERRIKVLKDGV